MELRLLARRIALAAPPIKRVHDELVRQNVINASVSAERDRLAAELAYSKPLLAELAAAIEERDSLELQLYVLGSDQQRAVTRNEALAAALREAEARAAAAAAAERARDDVVGDLARRTDLDEVYMKLTAKLTMLSSTLSGPAGGPQGDSKLYLDLLERALTGTLTEDPAMNLGSDTYDPEIRSFGRDWPRTAPTMIGAARLRNLRVLTERVLADDVPGDLLEAGVWRGGACMLMRAVLQARGVTDRTVWVADSFRGLPPPDPAYPADAGDTHSTVAELAVSVAEVRANFARYDLLDSQVRFLEGWFADTLPGAPIERLALLRLDGDMYSSTMQTLDALYAKVSSGGFVIVDDYILLGCRKAIHDFRDRHAVTEPMNDVDGAAVYWRKA